MRKLYGFLAVSCVIIICINIYSDTLSLVPRYLDVYHIIGTSNRTLPQNKSLISLNKTSHKSKPQIIFKNDNYCRTQRPKSQKNIGLPSSNNTIFSNNGDVNMTNQKKTGNVSKTIAPPNHSRNQSIYLTCPDLHKPDLMNVTRNHGHFQTVNQKVFAFSAYYDHRPPGPAIKIVTASHVKHNDGLLLCQLWYEESCEPDIRQVFKVDAHRHFPEMR